MAQLLSRKKSKRPSTKHVLPHISPASSVHTTPVHQGAPSARRKHLIAYGVLLGIFVILCIAFVLFLRYKPDYTYNTFRFTKSTCPATDQQCWYVEMKINNQPYTVPYYNHPSVVDKMLFDYDTMELLRVARNQEALVIIGIPNNAPGELGIAGTQLSRVLGKRYGILDFNVSARIIGGGADQVSCASANENTVVILFEQSDEPGVRLEAPACITIQAKDSKQAIAVAEMFTYRLLGVIPTVRQSASPSGPATIAPVNAPAPVAAPNATAP